MKKIVSLALALVLCLSMLPLNSAFAAQEVVNVYNWYDYMDETVFEIFEQETGIHVNKMYFTTNEDMMVQVRVSPGAYDLVFPSDYCVERMIAENMLAEINMDNIPNLVNIDPNQLNADYDPENKYSVPFIRRQHLHAGFHPRHPGRHPQIPGLLHEQPRHHRAEGRRR